MTFAEMANLSTLTPLSQRVIYSVLAPSPLLQSLPFEDVGDLQVLLMEATGIPTPNHRAINPIAITIQTAQFGQRTEQLKIMSDQIRIDRQLLNNKSTHVNPRTAAIEQYTKGVAYETNNMFVRGSPAVNPDQPAGIEYRYLTDARISDGSLAPATQLQVFDANDQNKGVTDADDRAMINDAHEVMSLIDGMNPDILLTNRQVWLRFGVAARNQRMFDTTKDMFGRAVMNFAGASIIDAGYTAAGAFNRTPQIIPTGTSANDLITDSVFAIKWGNTMIGGLQKMAPETIDLTQDASTFPNVSYAFEWVYGFHLTNPFAIALGRRFV